jgi:hypothetical protein
VIPGTTPADPEDRGDADPALVAALASDDDATIGPALLRARLLVPVVAVPAEQPAVGEAEMAVPALVAADGRRALPVFSSYDALRAWQPEARPVPMAGSRVVAAAVEEGYDGVVLDVAGPASYTLTGDLLQVLAEAARALQEHPGARLLAW